MRRSGNRRLRHRERERERERKRGTEGVDSREKRGRGRGGGRQTDTEANIGSIREIRRYDIWLKYSSLMSSCFLLMQRSWCIFFTRISSFDGIRSEQFSAI